MVVAANELETTLIQLLSRIAPEADFDELEPTDDIQEVLEIDSFDFLNFLISIDEACGVEIPESDYGQVRTLADIEAYICEHQK